MRRLSQSIVVVALSLIGVVVAPQHSRAEPLPADYSGLAGGDVLAIDIDTDSPAAPVITSPEDGSTTTDPTPPVTGTAEPGSEVIIFVDGEEVGSTVADEDGTFTFDLQGGLSLGKHEIVAKAVDEAGISSVPSSQVRFAVLAARSDAGQSPSDSLADTGGPQAWLPLVAGLGVLTGTGILAAARWRRRISRAGG